MKAESERNNPLMTTLAVVFMLLLLVGLGARFWLSEKAYDYAGPTHIAANAQDVFLFASGEIYRLNHGGELLGVAGADRTGLTDDPIDLRVTEEGRLLIAEQRPARVRSCDVDSWDCRLLAVLPAELVERQIKVLPGREPGSLLMTDSRGDMLWRLDAGENEPRQLLPRGVLAGPNDLAFGEDGLLWVADTDHRRIVELLPADDGAWLPGRRHSAVNRFTVGERHFPMMLARGADGRWWVTQTAKFSEPYSDLLVYDRLEGAQGRVDLPEGAWATDIVALGDALLVTDLERFAVYRIDAETMAVSGFGDEVFNGNLNRLRERRSHFDRLGHASLAVIILSAIAMLTAAVLATPRKKRWTRPRPPFDWASAPSEVPRVRGIHWLERDPKVERSLKWLEGLGFVMFVLMAVGGLAIYAWVRSQAGPEPDGELALKLKELGMIMLLAGLLLVLMIPILRFSTRAMKRRLGTDGKCLYIRLENGRELAADPSQLTYTDRLIVFQRYTLPLLGGQQRPLYAPGEVETWLAPLLRKSRKLSEWEAVKLLIFGKY